VICRGWANASTGDLRAQWLESNLGRSGRAAFWPDCEFGSVADLGCQPHPESIILEMSQGLGKEPVGLFHNFYSRWEMRHCRLTCPHCKLPASSPTFRQARYMRGDLALACEQCHESNPVTFWRFEGIEKPSPPKLVTLPTQGEAGAGLGRTGGTALTSEGRERLLPSDISY
jgi:hypothetical protein